MAVRFSKARAIQLVKSLSNNRFQSLSFARAAALLLSLLLGINPFLIITCRQLIIPDIMKKVMVLVALAIVTVSCGTRNTVSNISDLSNLSPALDESIMVNQQEIQDLLLKTGEHFINLGPDVPDVFHIDNIGLTAQIIHYCLKGLEVPYIKDTLGPGISDEIGFIKESIGEVS